MHRAKRTSSTANFINSVFVTNAERVNHVRVQTQHFEETTPRGYKATGCLLETRGGPTVFALNDIPPCAHTEYTSTAQGVERAPKFAALGHAETNAIAFAARAGLATEGATISLAWFPCINCSDAIVKAGIARLIATRPDESYKPDQYDFAGSLKLLEDAGVIVMFEK